MSSLRKIISARANGAKSRGPVTPEGKKISAMNALRHGLCARTLVLSNESRPQFEAVMQAYKNKFQPRDEVEMDLVEEMAVSKWRQRRLWNVETASINLKMDRQAKEIERQFERIDEPTRVAVAFTALTDESNSLNLWTRYETRIRANYEKAMTGIFTLQTIHPAQTPASNEPNPISGHFEEAA